MNNKTKTKSLKLAIMAIVLLLCLALAIGITGAFYQAKRQATGTLNMDQGIIIDYTGFGKETDGVWVRENEAITYKLFSDSNALPGENIVVNESGVRANSASIDFYARVKLSYKFYNGETPVTLENPSDLITTSSQFFGTDWVASGKNDGYFYYATGTILNKFTKDDTDFVDVFATDAKFVIESENFTGAISGGEGGGFVVDETTTIDKIEVFLTLETLQGDADADAEGWRIQIGDEEIVDISTPSEGKTELNIDEIVQGDKDGDIVITGNPAQPLTITISSKAFNGCTKLRLTLSNNSNIIYQIATDAFSSGAIIRYGSENVTSKLINPSTEGHETTGFAGKWQVSSPGLYLFLPSPITSTSSSYGDFQYTDDQGTWYFDLLDAKGDKVSPSALSSAQTGGISSLASTLASTSTYVARINRCENNSTLTKIVIPTYLGVSDASEKFVVDVIEDLRYGPIFSNKDIVQQIELPAKLRTVGACSFTNCQNLSSVTVPNTIIIIDGDAFSGCKKLAEFTIPNGVTTLGQYAFDYSGLTSITIPESVTSISTSTFADCSNLTSITVDEKNTHYHSEGDCLIETATRLLIQGCPNSVIPTDGSVTSLGSAAFRGFSKLYSITLPDSITSIDEIAFRNSSNLETIHIGAGISEVSWVQSVTKNITISENNPYLVTDGKTIFAKSNGNLTLSKFYSGETTYAIPAKLTIDDVEWNVTKIGNNSFKDCYQLTSVTIPEGITLLDEGAFYGCNGLTSIAIPNSVTKIADNGFNGCGLTSVTFGENSQLNSIGQRAFFLNNFTSIAFPKSLTLISYNAFVRMSTLETVTFAEGSKLEEIQGSAFAECTNLVSITLPSGLTELGGGVFDTCSKLESITIPSTVNKIGYYLFKNCSSLTSIVLPEGIKTITYNCFEGCTNLESVTIPSTCTTINDDAFKNCTSLISIALPEGITTIPKYCFSGCTSLQSVTIPSTCTSLGTAAFENCTNLVAIWNITYDLNGVNATGPALGQHTGESISELTFEGIIADAPTNIPEGYTFMGWSDGTTTYQPGDPCTFSLTNRKLTAVWSRN